MAEDCGDPVAAYTFNIHEVRVGTLHQPLLLVSCLLSCKTGVHQILSRHFVQITQLSRPMKIRWDKCDVRFRRASELNQLDSVVGLMDVWNLVQDGESERAGSVREEEEQHLITVD